MMHVIITVLMSLVAQATFDSALAHRHVATSTFEGVWVRRMEPIKDRYPLGSRLAVRGSSELWFWHGFDPTHGPMIAEAESTPSGMRVRVTYDPVCFYVTRLELLGPVQPVVPRPTPDPPAPLTTDFTWPSKVVDQRLLREQVRRSGWVHCQIYNARYWCVRP